MLLLSPLRGFGAPATMGNAAAPAASQDGWQSILMVNEVDTYTNVSGENETVAVNTFNFYVGANRGRVTPFVVRVNGDNDFTVLAVGQTRVSGIDYNAVGVYSLPFAPVAPTFEIPNGTILAAGYLTGNADGSGVNGSVIPFNNGGDQIWLTGGGGAGNSGSVVTGAPPVQGSSTLNLSRGYSYNIGIDAAPPTPLAPTNLFLSNTNLFAGMPTGTLVGVLTTIDPNLTDTHTYSFATGTGDTHNALFALNGDRLYTAAPMGPPGTLYSIRLRTTDNTGLFHEASFPLSVAGDQAPTSLLLTANSLSDASPIGANVGRLITGDANPADRHTYTLVPGAGDGNNPLFNIADDLLQVAQPFPPGATSLTVRVRSTDLSGLWIERDFLLLVTTSGLRLNEVMASNASGLTDEDGDSPDWIEIKNELAGTINLTGWYLT
ncbi:MAG: hypothetical protein AAF492_09165, partial [Verrucomicrobiota bacterium]